MGSEPKAERAPDIDDGSWAYLSLGESGDDSRLRDRMSAACRSSGWPAVSWSRPGAEVHDPGGDRFWAGIDHAIEHADVVVTVLGAASEVTDAELTAALRHGRPVIGLRMAPVGVAESDWEARLSQYSRGRLIDCTDPGDCDVVLQRALTDRAFAETIRDATVGKEA